MHGEVVDVEAGEVEGVEVFQVRRGQEHDHVPLSHEHHLACVKMQSMDEEKGEPVNLTF